MRLTPKEFELLVYFLRHPGKVLTHRALLAAAWGGVVWLTAAISMAAIELAFPQVYGGRLWIAIPEFLAILMYIALAMMAGRERPE